MGERKETTLRWIKDGLWAIAFAGLAAGIGRFFFGLGAATNMMDSLPWGWWKVFNMVAGAALATSGFIVAAIIYIFQLERYRSVARLSVVVGFLGYGSSLVALIFDIGLPHRGWHPFFMWNPHSFLFEVFWCVSIYWGVTALELLPIITERFPLRKATHWLHEKMLPFVVLGITLSTMHHSSLGSLFMTSPTRLHPLWHSMWIPPEFFISAMGAGMATIVLLMLNISWLFGRPLDRKVVNGLAIWSASFLALYLVVKIADFTFNDKWGFVFGPETTWESRVFWLEISVQAILPVILLGLPTVRNTRFGLAVGVTMAFFGLIMHRINTGIVGYFRNSEATYFPNVSELVVSFGVLSAAALFFFLMVDKFYVLDEPEDHSHHDDDDEEEEVADPEQGGIRMWTREEAMALVTGQGALRAVRIFVVFIPLTWIALSSQATGAFEPIRNPVNEAVLAKDAQRSVFALDANRNGMTTDFTHAKHTRHFVKVYDLADERESCQKCHHLSLPKDKNTSCRRCHADMLVDTPMFRLENHTARFESQAQYDAFLAVDLSDRRQALAACQQCHKEEGKQPMLGLADYSKKGFTPFAPGFKDAMHGSCLTCHRQREMEKKEDTASAKSRGNCLYCHRDWADRGLFSEEELATLAPDPFVSGVSEEQREQARIEREALLAPEQGEVDAPDMPQGASGGPEMGTGPVSPKDDTVARTP